jgi:enolase
LGISFASIGDACEFIIRCVAEVGLVAKEQVSIALDLAATQFYINGRYELITESSSYASSEFVNHMNNLVRSLPIVSIEDPFAEDDWQSWQEFKRKAPTELQIIGDDLFTTNLARLEMGIGESSANAILIKPNQNGLVTRTAEVLKLAKRNEFRTIVSARSGESEDSWLADLAVGWQAGQIKVGSTHGSERTAKWNRLLELEVTEKTRFCNPFNPANEREN